MLRELGVRFMLSVSVQKVEKLFDFACKLVGMSLLSCIAIADILG